MECQKSSRIFHTSWTILKNLARSFIRRSFQDAYLKWQTKMQVTNMGLLYVVGCTEQWQLVFISLIAENPRKITRNYYIEFDISILCNLE